MGILRNRGDNGQQPPDPDEVEERQMRLRGLEQAHQQHTGGFDKDILQYLAQTDLDPDAKEEFKTYLTRDWVFANLNEAELNELKWYLRALKEMFIASFPTKECLIIGETRAAINDEPADTKTPLTSRDKLEINRIFELLWIRATRSKDMTQQRILRTNISQSQVDRPEDRGGRGGILGRIRR